MKKFIITIDTEGDNLWNWKEGRAITTQNVYYLSRFQELCNKFHFKPVYLSNWEMLHNKDFIVFMKETLKEKACELGMHLHAWNTPPIVELPIWEKSGHPYLIEYPLDIMEAKIDSMTQLIRDQFGFTPVSHRAGRWAMNDEYFKRLQKYGYKVDCSYTPGINWKSNRGQTQDFGGADYREVNSSPGMIHGILEVPVTIANTKKFFMPSKLSVKKILKAFYFTVKGQNVWLRPDGYNLRAMEWLIDRISASGTDYLMFMLHSSELMPGGSPTFQTEKDIDELYLHMETIFEKINQDYVGTTLQEYYTDMQGHFV